MISITREQGSHRQFQRENDMERGKAGGGRLVRGSTERRERKSMKIVSLNVGLPREVLWHGRSVTTGIYKEPAAGGVARPEMQFAGRPPRGLGGPGGRRTRGS